jgi:lipid-A-disaccharide synthase
MKQGQFPNLLSQEAVEMLDILILSNGPGEVTTWVRPVVKALRQQAVPNVRISLILSPCPNASGQEVAIAQTYPEIDRVQGAEHFLPFLLWGKTVENWHWSHRGLVIFLGGDQFFPVLIGKRLGYKILIYGEWETRWHRWVDRFAVMKPNLIAKAPRYANKFTVVGDLMADVSQTAAVTPANQSNSTAPQRYLVGLLPGSKPAKLAQGVPLALAIVEQVRQANSQVDFVIPVAPTLDLQRLVQFAHPKQNPLIAYFGDVTAELMWDGETPYLQTNQGTRIRLWTRAPAHDLLVQCDLCLTTVGANTAELGALTVPMIVLVPTQQLDAMRAWDGLPGLLANLPGVGSAFAKLINTWFLKQKRLLAWPNIWAGEAIVPELVGELQPQQVASLVLEWLANPETLDQIRQKLHQVRGEPGAAQKIAQLAYALLQAESSASKPGHL